MGRDQDLRVGKLLIWRKDPRARLPERASPGAVGFDLFALEREEVPPGHQAFVRTGLVAKAPRPYALFIFPRSSLFRKKGLVFPHSVGVIDFDYCGEEDELMVPVLNLTSSPVVVEAGERIAQLVLLRVLPEPELEEVMGPPGSNSRGGFGSTGGYGED